MLSTKERLSDYISHLFASVGAMNAISAEEFFFLQVMSQTFGVGTEEYKAACRILRGVQRGKVKVIGKSLAS